jgi:3-deoxy-manno-octulosonate cytidylyltransferase (CMP-KDO synthetase)
MNNFHVIIPARYQSTRLPAKPLALIGDLPMIVHVCYRAKESGAESVTVATDDQRILDNVISHGFNAVMTRSDHVSGSDRLFEAAELIGLSDDEIIVNVQGDEPFIPANNIQAVAQLLNQTNRMATLCCPIKTVKEVMDANAVKVIFNQSNQAIYFSRSPIPFSRDKTLVVDQPLPSNYYRHIGIYAYTKKFLQQFINWPASHLELTESLEQLRVIDNGHSIAIDCIDQAPPHGVDTQADLENARHYYTNLQAV